MDSEIYDRRGWISLNRAFHVCFTFLSKAYLNLPQGEFIQRMVDDDLFSSWPLSSSSTTTSKGIEKMQKFCAQWNPRQLEELKLDYTRLFIGLPKTLSPPYESVYLGKDHILFESYTLEVRGFYQQFNLHVDHLNKIPDDHIGLELYFCASLCQMCADALELDGNQIPLQEKYQRALKKFLHGHLLQWIDLFIPDVLNNADTQYFRGIAYLTQGMIADLANFLGIKTF